MTQLLIEDFLPGRGTPPPAPFVKGSETSREAAEAIAPHLNQQQERVFRLLGNAAEGGLTDEEMQVRLRLNPSSQRPRRVELVESGMVEDSGETRPTQSGRKAVVWRLTPAGREWFLIGEGGPL